MPETFLSWQEGTVIRSWLLDLLNRALIGDPELDDLRGYANDSGEGRWTVQAAVEHAVPLPAISASLFARFASRQDDSPRCASSPPSASSSAATPSRPSGDGDGDSPAPTSPRPSSDGLSTVRCSSSPGLCGVDHGGNGSAPGEGLLFNQAGVVRASPGREGPSAGGRRSRGGLAGWRWGGSTLGWVHVAHLSLQDFRSYPAAEVALEPGVTAFVGPNGQGKTNLVEAIGYVASHGSHRAATDAPLVRHGRRVRSSGPGW